MIIGSWPIEQLRDAARHGQGIVIANDELMLSRTVGEHRRLCSAAEALSVLEPTLDDDPPAPPIVRAALIQYAIELEEIFNELLYDIIFAGATLPFGPLINGWRSLPNGTRVQHTCIGLWDVRSLHTKELYTLLLQQSITDRDP